MEFRFRAKSGNKTFDEPSYGPCRYVVIRVIRQYGHFTETLFFDIVATKGENLNVYIL